MDKDEDLRTPDDLEGHAKECERCAADALRQAEEATQRAREWQDLAVKARQKAAARHSPAPKAESKPVPDAATKAATKAARKAPAKRGKR